MGTKTRPRVFKNTEAPVMVAQVDPTPPSEDFRDEMPILGDVPDLGAVEAEIYSSVLLKIPQTVYNDYQKVAQAQDQTVEEVMQHRLASCKSHNAVRGLWFSDSERKQLEDLLQKRPIEVASQALSTLTNLGSIQIEGLHIVLTPAQRKVLGLAMYGGRTPQKFFEDMIRRELKV